MNPVIRCGCAVLAVMLAGCASLYSGGQAPQQLPELEGVRSYQVTSCGQHGDGRQSLLVIQPQGTTSWRMLLLDPFGAPQARQIIEHGRWRNDGFLPPNPAARQLFASVLGQLAPRAGLSRVYPGMTVRREDGGEVFSQRQEMRWRIMPLSPSRESTGTGDGVLASWAVQLPDGAQWCIRRLEMAGEEGS